MPWTLKFHHLLVGLCHVFLGDAFSPFWINPHVSPRVAPALFAFPLEAKDRVVIFYSPNFHRHVVAQVDCGNSISNVLESFAFLDEAEQKYPHARRALTMHSSIIPTMAGLGLEDRDGYIQVCTEKFLGNTKEEMVPSTLASMTRGPEIHRLQEICNRLTAKIGSSFLSFFPEDEIDLVCERIQFLVAPLPGQIKQEGMDWPKMFFQGYGAGFTDTQAVSAILGLRHLLFADPAKVLKEKPPTPYFIAALGVTVESLNQARDAMSSLLDGECAPDVATFAHLKSLGLSWHQCYILVQAFATSILSCALERTWEVYDGPARKQLSEASINYLRLRFQLYPAEIVCMLRTHSRLTTYSVKVLRSHADALQSQFGLSSRSLRQLILKSPSVLGVSEIKVAQRASFFRQRLNLSTSEMHKLLQQFPSILEYSLEKNLEPKLEFFINEAGIRMDIFIRAIVARPYLLTSSLEKSLQPAVYGLRDRCQLPPEELAAIYSRVPVLLSCKWATNLEPKINFLVNYLGLDDEALKLLVISSPRILTHSLATSLKPKLHLLEELAAGNVTQVVQVVQNNPSLLDMTKVALSRRGILLRMRNITFLEGFASGKSNLMEKPGGQRKPLARRKRPVLEILGSEVLQTWSDVDSAAVAIGSTRANMYNILKTGRTYKGKSYVYGSLPQIDDMESNGSPPRVNTIQDKGLAAQTFRDVLEQWSISIGSLPENSLGVTGKSVHLAAYVTSGVYPTGIPMRGVRQTSGSLLYFPQLQGCSIANELLTTAIRDTIDTQVLPDLAGTDFDQGIVLSFYPGTRPSRNRGGLWACSNALRVATELIASDPTLKEYDVNLDIITDSGYIVELLRDAEALLKWGSHSRRKDFVYDGPEPLWRVNVDLLYPLARTYYRMTHQLFAAPKYGNRKALLAQSIRIRFRHQSELTWTGEDKIIQNGYKVAKRAAEWQHNREYSGIFRLEAPRVT